MPLRQHVPLSGCWKGWWDQAFHIKGGAYLKSKESITCSPSWFQQRSRSCPFPHRSLDVCLGKGWFGADLGCWCWPRMPPGHPGPAGAGARPPPHALLVWGAVVYCTALTPCTCFEPHAARRKLQDWYVVPVCRIKTFLMSCLQPPSTWTILWLLWVWQLFRSASGAWVTWIHVLC